MKKHTNPSSRLSSGIAFTLALAGSGCGLAVDSSGKPPDGARPEVPDLGPELPVYTPDEDGIERLHGIEGVLRQTKLRGTANGGNADGVHSCDQYSTYHHYEHGGGEGGTQLHIIGILAPTSTAYDSSGEEHGPVTVQVNRPGSSVLVLSSRFATEWNVEVADGSTVEGVITFGYFKNRVNAPEGVPVVAYSFYEDDVNPGDTPTEWPSFYTTELVDTAELLTGLELTSFRGCEASDIFRIDEPGALRPPHAVSPSPDPRLIPGCESLATESGFCLSVDHGKGDTIPNVEMVGLDSGTTCGAFPVPDIALPDYSLGWAGDYLYKCVYRRGLARISLVDGSMDVAPISCDSVTADGDGLIAVVSFEKYPNAPWFVVRFASFEDAVEGAPERVYEIAPESRGPLAVQGNHLYFAKTGTHSVSFVELADGAEFQTITLEGFDDLDDLIQGMDVTEDGKLLVTSYSFDGGGPHIFDAATGAFQGSIENALDGGSAGLECFSNGTAE
ncbi:MAG TPA: hypothetical protein VNM90_07705 [Haliangium sp.]|nr:hypothetical protein [Haliangium sp.]